MEKVKLLTLFKKRSINNSILNYKIMKTVEFGKMNGYPQYLQIKLVKGGGVMIDMCVDPNNKPEKGDTLQKFNDTYNVLEVIEERPAKGKHQPGILWQRLKCS